MSCSASTVTGQKLRLGAMCRQPVFTFRGDPRVGGGLGGLPEWFGQRKVAGPEWAKDLLGPALFWIRVIEARPNGFGVAASL